MRPVDHLAAFCESLTQSDERWEGQPLKPEAWQRRFWREALDDWRFLACLANPTRLTVSRLTPTSAATWRCDFPAASPSPNLLEREGWPVSPDTGEPPHRAAAATLHAKPACGPRQRPLPDPVLAPREER